MFSKEFMSFLITYSGNDENLPQKEDDTQEIQFKSVKVEEAARIVIASIKETI